MIIHIMEQLKRDCFMSNQTHYIGSSKKIIIIKILNLKFVMLLGYQNMKIFLQKVTLEISLKKFLSLKKS